MINASAVVVSFFHIKNHLNNLIKSNKDIFIECEWAKDAETLSYGELQTFGVRKMIYFSLELNISNSHRTHEIEKNFYLSK